MKVGILLMLTTLLAGSDLVAQSCKNGPVSILSRKMDILYFKICKELIGGRVEVYSPGGELLASAEIAKNKILIDFYFERPGKYVIKFKNGGSGKDFEFSKDQPPPLAVAHLDYQIVISQQ